MVHPRWKGGHTRPRPLPWCIAQPRRYRVCAHTVFLRATVADPKANTVTSLTWSNPPLATGLALPCIEHYFLGQGVGITSTRKVMTIHGRCRTWSVPQPTFPPMLGLRRHVVRAVRARQAIAARVTPDLMLLSVIQHTRRGEGSGGDAGVVLLKNLARMQHAACGNTTRAVPCYRYPAAISSPPARQLVRASIPRMDQGGKGVYPGFFVCPPTVAPPFFTPP